MKAKPVIYNNSRNIEKIITRTEKREKVLNEIRKYCKIKHYKISKLLNDSTVSAFVTKKTGSK